MNANVESSSFTGRLLGNRWLVGDPLGSGSFGVVHAGVERATGAPVAIKLLHPQFIHHGETIARFWNEAEALRRLNHPNVLTFLDVGVTDDGVPFLVTELLTGETLRDLLNREGALPPERAMRLLGPAAHALHHAHLLGIVHRDLKPENIFRVRRDGLGTTKILDFGMAKLLDTAPGRKLSQTGVMIGTMAYSPPEQMQGVGDIDHRADQFGFAALMFEALTGQRPFPQTQPFQLFQAVTSGIRPKASSVRPDLSPGVDEVLGRALDPDRERRFSDVEQFYLELTKALTTPDYKSGDATFAVAPPARAPSADVVPMRAAPPPRYSPVREEQTKPLRGPDAHATANDDPRLITMQSGAAPRIGLTTLSEGTAPPAEAPDTAPTGTAAPEEPLRQTLASGTHSALAPAGSVPPPASHERPVGSAPSPMPPQVAPPPRRVPFPNEGEPPAANAAGTPAWMWIAIVAVVLAVALAIWKFGVAR